jgi:hypothetical protein
VRFVTQHAKDTLDEIAGKPRPSGWSTKKDSALRRLWGDAHFFEADVISNLKRRILPSIDRPESMLVKRNAVFAGVWQHHLLTFHHTTAIEFVNAWGAVFAMFQLYHAVRNLTPAAGDCDPKTAWLLMDLVNNMQGVGRFWVGQAPRVVEDRWKQWCLCQGIPLAKFVASGGAVPLASASNSPRRELPTLAPVSLVLRGRLGNDTPGRARVNMTLEDVRAIVGEGQRRSLAGEDHLTLSPAALIKALATAVGAEIGHLHFDYLRLHSQCWELLAELQRIMDPLFRQACKGRPDYIPSEAQLPQLVGIIFRAAAGLAPGLGERDRKKLLEAARKNIGLLLDERKNAPVNAKMKWFNLC